MTRSLLGSLLALLFAVGVANASPITFFGQDLSSGPDDVRIPSHATADAARGSFLPSLPFHATQSFPDGLEAGESGPIAGPAGATLTGGGKSANLGTGTDGSGGFPISGSAYWQLDDPSFKIELTGLAIGIGFYGIDIGDAGGQLKITLSNGSTFSMPSTPSPSGSVFYFGVIDADNPFNLVTFERSDPTILERFNFDDFTIGYASQELPLAPTPEPGTLLLLGSSLAGIGSALWRRRKAAVTAD